jgi:hypothetical protein
MRPVFHSMPPRAKREDNMLYHQYDQRELVNERIARLHGERDRDRLAARARQGVQSQPSAPVHLIGRTLIRLGERLTGDAATIRPRPVVDPDGQPAA